MNVLAINYTLEPASACGIFQERTVEERKAEFSVLNE